jgi:hypothetical protein
MVQCDALHRSDARAEERGGRSRTQSPRTVTRLQGHRHEMAVERELEDLQSVSAPPRLPTTVSRNARARSIAAHALQVHFESA